jgi:hypothetical protein
MASAAPPEPAWDAALASSVAALRRVAGYALPPELDRRVLELGERKDELTPAERAELLAWVAFTQQRSVEKLEAQAALARLAALRPELMPA